MLSKRTRDQLEKLPPDQRAKADAALARIDTPEYRAAEEAARRQYADHPSPRALVERGEIDPERIMTGAAEESLALALSTLKAARRSRGVSLADLSRRTGIDLASLSRLESGKNPNPTFETLSRYALALGLRLGLTLVETGEPTPAMGGAGPDSNP